MSHIVEEEIKLKLDAETHERLLIHINHACGGAIALHQENYFFDSTDEILRQHLMSVRVRRQNNKIFLTVKQKRESQDLVHRQDEHEVQLNSACWPSIVTDSAHLNEILPIPQHCLDILGNKTLIPFMHFTNQRWHIQDGKHEICLDHSLFNDTIHEYELEIESSDVQAAAKKWLPLLKQWGYTEIAQSQSKLERCYNYARK